MIVNPAVAIFTVTNANYEFENENEVKTEWKLKDLSPTTAKIRDAIFTLIVCLTILVDVLVITWMLDINFGLCEDFSLFCESIPGSWPMMLFVAVIGAAVGIIPAAIVFFILFIFLMPFIAEEVEIAK